MKNGAVDYPVDPRASAVVIGTPGVDLRPVAREDLEAVADEWPVHPDTPPGVVNQLAVARQLFTHSLLVWEFGAVAVAWSLLAVEAALKIATGPHPPSGLYKLIAEASTQGLITPEQEAELDRARRLRNQFAHPDGQPVWSLWMAAPALRASHHAIASVFARGGACRI